MFLLLYFVLILLLLPNASPVIWIFLGAFGGQMQRRLGKLGQTVLKEKNRYWIRDIQDGLIYTNDERDILDISSIDEIRTDTEELCPYIVVEYYDTPFIHRVLFPDAGRAFTKKILYLPPKDET